MPDAKCARAGSWAHDWALQVVYAWLKDCRSVSDLTFFFLFFYFLFPLPFQRRNENLALPSAEQQALENVKAGLETWEYTARNTLMYYPTGETCRFLRRGIGSRWVDSKQCFQHFYRWLSRWLVILHFFFCEAQDMQSCLKKVLFSFFFSFPFLSLDLAPLLLIAKFDHLLFVVENLIICIIEALVFRSRRSFQFGLSYLWALSCHLYSFIASAQRVLLGLVGPLVATENYIIL